MAFNGAGVFNRLYSWVTDAANSVFIDATRMDNEMNGFATGLSTCLTKDGQSTPTANILMGGFKITGLANGVGASDAATVGQVPVPNVYSAVATRSGSNTFAADSATHVLTYDTSTYDPHSELTIGSGTFTALVSGWYSVQLCCSLSCAGAAPPRIYFTTSASLHSYATGVQFAYQGISGANESLAIGTVVALAAGTSVSVLGLGSGGGNITYAGTAFIVTRLGDV